MSGPSVIVVSRHRPVELHLCLLALTQQDHPDFEVIVVADPGGLAVAQGFAVKAVPFDEPNISKARNAGLSEAAGDVVAFIDDDAVAEPSWLSRLVAPFTVPEVMAAGGFVRGRSGIRVQWGAAWIDRFGADHPFVIEGGGGVFDALPDRAIKTTGTNCAFRRDVLLAIGGFDPAYRYYHDETDVNLRLRARTAVVPMAQVVHAFAASERRRADRAPLSLRDIAASSAVFLRRHGGPVDLEAARVRLRAEQADRLARHARAGRVGTPDIRALLQGFDSGWAEGIAMDLAALPPLAPTRSAFQRLPGTGPRPGAVLWAWRGWRGRREAEAAEAVRRGRIVTLCCLSLTARAHRLVFTAQGYWRHEGGLFGRVDHSVPLLRMRPLASWLKGVKEMAARTRPIA